MDKSKLNCDITLKNMTPKQARIAMTLWYDCENMSQVDAVIKIYGPAALDILRQIVQARHDYLVANSVDEIKTQEALEPRVDISLKDARKVLDKFRTASIMRYIH